MTWKRNYKNNIQLNDTLSQTLWCLLTLRVISNFTTLISGHSGHRGTN